MSLNVWGFREVRPALSNKPERRQGAMEALLLQQEEGKGRVIIDKKAKMLINGLSFGYIYGQTKGGELRQVGERSRPQVVKNMYSHICEATEYVALDNKSVGGIGTPGQAELQNITPSEPSLVGVISGARYEAGTCCH